MRRIDGRVRKLEDRLGITPEPRFRIILTDRDFAPAEEAAYLRVLEEAGLLNPNGFAVVLLTHIPRGLSVEEMERFVREKHGVGVPKTPPSPGVEIVLEGRSTKDSGRPGR
jgi:hypothetical protein